MIDTIKLMVNDFEITKPELFYPNAAQVLELSRTSASAVQRPRKSDHQLGLYKPSLRLVKHPVEGGGVSIFLLIEFSAPKLLYGNNFEECETSDFKTLLTKLKDVLEPMGVLISIDALSEAKVVAIHYGKNYVLTDYSVPYTYMEEMSRANISRVFDVNQADFRNEGHSWKFRTNTFEFTVYDKIRDLEKANVSYKRAVESNQRGQSAFLNPLRRLRQDKPFEVLRLEIRLTNTRSIKKLLNNIGVNVDPTLRTLFSAKIAKGACLFHLKKVREALLLSNTREQTGFTKYVSDLLQMNPTKQPKLLFLYSAYKEIVKEKGERVARLLIDPKNNGSWFRYRQQFKQIAEPNVRFRIDDLIAMTELFEPTKLSTYSHNLLIDVK